MIIHFKNGYSVHVTDCKGKSKKEILDAATFCMRTTKARDAELSKNITTNISFGAKRLKEALERAKKGDGQQLATEISYLERDLMADASENHKNYVKMYRKEVIDKIVDQYDSALREIKKYEVVEGNLIERLERLLNRIKENWYGKKEVEKTEEIEVEDKKAIKDIPYYQPTDYPSIKSEYSIERLKKEIAHEGSDGQEWQDEIEEVYKELDEFIDGGREVLVSAGWSKDDARHAISERYDDLLKVLRKAGQTDHYMKLREKIKVLKKVWDLTR